MIADAIEQTTHRFQTAENLKNKTHHKRNVTDTKPTYITEDTQCNIYKRCQTQARREDEVNVDDTKQIIQREKDAAFDGFLVVITNGPFSDIHPGSSSWLK